MNGLISQASKQTNKQKRPKSGWLVIAINVGEMMWLESVEYQTSV